MQLYTKKESGEFVEATESELNEVFKSKSDVIVSKRIEQIREKELEKARPEYEKKIREELTPKIQTELKAELEKDYQGKLDKVNKKALELETSLRRKTIAAEYGLKAEAEKFLGDGNEEEMRANADSLKALGSSTNQNLPEKNSGTAPSEVAEKYGLDVQI